MRNESAKQLGVSAGRRGFRSTLWPTPGGTSLARALTKPARKVIVAASGILLATSSFVASGALADSPGAVNQPAGARLPVQELRIVNYFPSNAGWTDMWANYSRSTTVSDFAAIKALDANTVRIIVQPDAVGYPIVNPVDRAELDDMIRVATGDGLSVQLTLFDMWHAYSQISNSMRWVSSLLADQAGNPTIALVELQNEMPLTRESLAWARSLLPYLQSVLPGVPRTISEPGSEGLAPTKKLLSDIPESDIDVVDVHYYGDPSRAAQELKQVLSVAEGRPVMIGETGVSTHGTSQGEEAQARFYKIMGETTNALGLPPPSPWMLNDVHRAGGEHLDANQEYFGLRRSDGAWKPAAVIVQDIFRGNIPTSWSTESTDAPGGDTFGDWTEFDPSEGSPFVASTPSYEGGKSICYSHTGGSAEKLPALVQTFPVLKQGEDFDVSAWLHRTAGTGEEVIAIAEFNANGIYIGEVDSRAATGSGGWQELSVTSSEPSNVASIAINLKAGYESGTACWSDINIADNGL